MNELASLNETEDHIVFSPSVRKSFQRSNISNLKIIQIILHIIMMILYPMATLFTIG